MKKTLLLAIAGLLGLGSLSAQTAVKGVSWNSTITPATELKDGGKYLLYDASKLMNADNQNAQQCAWRKVSDGVTVGGYGIATAPLESGSLPYAECVFELVKNGSNWQFKHLGTGKYIPQINSEQKTAMPLSFTPGNWTVTLKEDISAFRVKSSTNNQCWDGNDSFGLITWAGGVTNDAEVHWYQFFDIEDTQITVDNPVSLTFNFQSTSGVVATYTIYGCAGETYTTTFPTKGDKVYTGTFPDASNNINVWSVERVFSNGITDIIDWIVEGENWSMNAVSVDGVYSVGAQSVTGVSAPIEVPYTLADGVRPFKLVNVRYPNQWAVTTATGLNHTGNADFAAGEWFFDVPAGDYFKIYSLTQSKYLGSVTGAVDQIPFADTPGIYTMQKVACFAEAICNSTNTNLGSQVYFNWRSNAIGTWSVGTPNDAGSLWFMVYDKETYEHNRDSFTAEVNGSNGQIQSVGALPAAIASAQEVYNLLVESGLEDVTITNLKTLIDKSASLRFGVVGNDIPKYLTDIATATEAARNYLNSHIRVELNYPLLNGRKYSYTRYVDLNSKVADIVVGIELPLEFTYSTETTELTITEATTINVVGSWAFPAIEFGRVYRMALRNMRANEGDTYFYANTSDNTIKTTLALHKEALTPERLFYFEDAGSDADTVRVTLHTIAKPGFGLTMGTTANDRGNISDGTLSETPLTFSVVSNSWNGVPATEFSFSLKHRGTTAGHVNDINGQLGAWTHANSQNDNGSAFRLYSLTADEINAVVGAPDKVKQDAISNPNVYNITELCKYAVVNEAKALFAHFAGMPIDAMTAGVNVPGRGSADAIRGDDALNNLFTDATAEALPDMTVVAEHNGYIILHQPNLVKSFDTTDGALFVIKNSDTNQDRGYLINSEGRVMSSKAKGIQTANADTTDPNYHFAFITVGEGDNAKKYLYNLGADKFMNAFGEKTDATWTSTANAADYTWRFSDVPTPINEIVDFNPAVAHSFGLLAGLPPTNNENWSDTDAHEGGLSMIDQGVRPVLVTYGMTTRRDGNGLIATYAGQLADDQVQRLRDRIADAHAKVAAAEAAIPSGISEENHIVNHYTPATVDRIKAETSTPDYKHYLLENGERQGFVDNMVYTFINANNQALGFDDNGNQIEDGNFESCNTETARAFFYWNAVPVTTSGEESVAAQALDATVTYRFTHEHDKTLKEMTLNGLTQHELGTSTLGKVNLNGVDYEVTSYSGKAVTTDIAEITAEGNRGADVIFDLQGRRVNKAAKGVYIINGKKMLVK